MTDRITRIREALVTTFSPLECKLEDESALHIGHAGAASGAGHFRLTIVSALFEGQNRVERHRLVYDCLRDLMRTEIHALNIEALTPAEAAAKKTG